MIHRLRFICAISRYAEIVLERRAGASLFVSGWQVGQNDTFLHIAT